MTKNITLELLVDKTTSYGDESFLAEISHNLIKELEEINITSVQLKTKNNIKDGAKSSAPIDWGNILVALIASGGVITTLISTISSFVKRHEVRSITIKSRGKELVVSGISSREQQDLIDVFILDLLSEIEENKNEW